MTSLFFADLVREACTGTGTGALALGGALPGHRPFAGTVPPGARFHYCIAGATRPEQWETGEGEIADGALVRDPIASSNGGGAVDFSPGLKTVALTASAAWFEGQQAAVAGKAALAGADFAGPLSAPSLVLANDLAIAHGGTGASSAPAARNNLGLGTMAQENAAHYSKPAADETFTGRKVLRFSDNRAFEIANFAAAPARVEAASGDSSAFLSFLIPGRSVGILGIDDADWKWKATDPLSGTVRGLALQETTVSFAAVHAGGAQVLGTRRTGWSAPTGTATRTGFDTATVGTAQLAERVKALIDDLAAHGLIGS